MADVQIEHGFTRIADELLEALPLGGFTAREFKVLLVLIRLTYGFGKVEDAISAGQISDRTGLHRRHVQVVLAGLENRGVVHVRRPGARRTSVIRIEKNFDRWSPADTCTGASTGTSGSARSSDTAGGATGTRGGVSAGTSGGALQREETEEEEAPAIADAATASDLIRNTGYSLSPRCLLELQEMRPRGILYPLEQIAAWFIAKAPKMRAQGKTALWRAAPNWWERATPEEVEAAVAALGNRRFQDRYGREAESAPPEPQPTGTLGGATA